MGQQRGETKAGQGGSDAGGGGSGPRRRALKGSQERKVGRSSPMAKLLLESLSGAARCAHWTPALMLPCHTCGNVSSQALKDSPSECSFLGAQ